MCPYTAVSAELHKGLLLLFFFRVVFYDATSACYGVDKPFEAEQFIVVFHERFKLETRFQFTRALLLFCKWQAYARQRTCSAFSYTACSIGLTKHMNFTLFRRSQNETNLARCSSEWFCYSITRLISWRKISSVRVPLNLPRTSPHIAECLRPDHISWSVFLLGNSEFCTYRTSELATTMRKTRRLACALWSSWWNARCVCVLSRNLKKPVPCTKPPFLNRCVERCTRLLQGTSRTLSLVLLRWGILRCIRTMRQATFLLITFVLFPFFQSWTHLPTCQFRSLYENPRALVLVSAADNKGVNLPKLTLWTTLWTTLRTIVATTVQTPVWTKNQKSGCAHQHLRAGSPDIPLPCVLFSCDFHCNNLNFRCITTCRRMFIPKEDRKG